MFKPCRIHYEQKMLREADPKIDGVGGSMRGENMMEWDGIVYGPEDSPYEGGRFEISITLSDTYPLTPPKAFFKTKVWHPNISSQTGAICLSILKKDNWRPSLNMQTLLISIRSLLNEPVPNDPQDGVVAKQLLDHPEVFKATARMWAIQYAGAPGNVEDVVIPDPTQDPLYNLTDDARELVQMGIPPELAVSTLENNNNDIHRAVTVLFGNS